jgi:hyperosmotically inducible protein
MPKPKLPKLVFAGCMSAALAATMTLTGCHMFNEQSGERTAGRTLDDKTIQADVKENLKKDPLYKFSDVDVKTFDGVVQLSGFVNSDEQKRRAEEIARQTPGVQQVVNAIALKPNVNTLQPTGAETTPRTTPRDPNSTDKP